MTLREKMLELINSRQEFRSVPHNDENAASGNREIIVTFPGIVWIATSLDSEATMYSIPSTAENESSDILLTLCLEPPTRWPAPYNHEYRNEGEL